MVILMVNYKIKYMIMIVLAIFMIQAVSASGINETVNADMHEIIIDEVTIEETTQITNINERSMDDIDECENTFNKVTSEYIHPESNNSNINSFEKSFEVEISSNHYDETYFDHVLNDSLSIDLDSDLNVTTPTSIYMDFDFNNEFEVLICIKLGYIFESYDLDRCVFKVYEFKKSNILTHDILAFYNNYCHVLTHAVNKDIILSNDKLNSEFAYCIDNSIVGIANDLSKNVSNSYFSILSFTSRIFLINSYSNIFSQYFSNNDVYVFFHNLTIK